MTPLASFLPFVLPHAQSVPDMLAEQYLRLAAIEFCQRTRAWRHTAEIDVAGYVRNDVPVPDKSELFEIEETWFKLEGGQYGRPLDRVPFDQVDPNILPTGETPANGAAPSAFTQDQPGSIIVVPPALGKLRISMFLVPTIAADSVPDFLFQKHAVIIADGALAQIMLTPGQPYTSPEIAVARRSMFVSATDALFRLGKRGQQRAPTRARSSFV